MKKLPLKITNPVIYLKFLSLSLLLLKSAVGQEIPFADYNGEPKNENIGFVTNSGQIINTNNENENDILFHSIRANPKTYFSQDRVSFLSGKIADDDANNDTLYRLDLTWVGENRLNSIPYSEEMTGEKMNYYVNNCPNNCGQLNIYKSIKFESIYDKINLIVSSNKYFYKFYFECLPQSQPNNIELEILGADSIIIYGDLLVVYQDGIKLTLSTPMAYQISSNGTITGLSWKPKMNKNSSGTISLNTNGNYYDTNKTLVYMFKDYREQSSTYDKKNLVKGKLEGGSGWDTYYDIDIFVPSDGNEIPFVCGQTQSTNFPTTYKYFGNNGGSHEILVVKYDNQLNRIWSIVYGGSGSDGYLSRYGISIDNSGNSFIAAGTNSSNIPLIDITGNNDHFDGVTNGNEIVISRFDFNGNHTYASFFGGDGTADPGDIIVDKSSGDFYVCGREGGYPIVDPGNGAFPSGYPNQNLASNFIAKFNSSLGIIWSTGFGGINSSGLDYEINSLEIDQNDKLIISGRAANGTNFPIKNLSGAINFSHSGGLWDAFISRFDNNLNLEWSTYFGGSGKDYANRVIVTNQNEIAITGYTQTTSSFLSSQPSGSYEQNTFGGNGTNFFGDAFLTVLNPNGSLKYSQYLGGQSGDEGFAITSPRKGLGNNIFTAGYSRSSNFPISNNQSNLLYVNNTLGNPNDSYKDGYIASYDKDIDLKWSTFIGGGSTEPGNGDDEILSGDCHELFVYFVGNTSSSNFRPINGFSDTYNGGVSDGFILKFQMEGTPLFLNNLTKNKMDLILYPIPTSNVINISSENIPSTEIEKIKIFDSKGTCIKVLEISSQTLSFDISDLSNGLYFAKIELKNKTIINGQKILIER